jgi:hypothetical protein
MVLLRRRISPLAAAMLVAAIGAALALMALAVPQASAQAGHRSARQERIGELGADWWQWAAQKPKPINPTVGSYSGGPKCDGASGERGVWFLAGSYNGTKVVRHCTIPVGTKLFFPIVNYFNGDRKAKFDEKTYRHDVNRFIDKALKGGTTYATVDGKPARPVSGERADTPVFTLTFPKHNLYGAPPGFTQLSVADGVWVLEHPLSKGEHPLSKIEHPLSKGEHTIRFGGSFPNAPGGGFEQDNTYKLRVVSRAQWNETH